MFVSINLHKGVYIKQFKANVNNTLKKAIQTHCEEVIRGFMIKKQIKSSLKSCG